MSLKSFLPLIFLVSFSLFGQANSKKNIYIYFDNDKDALIQTDKDSVTTFYNIYVNSPNPYLFVNYRKFNAHQRVLSINELQKIKTHILNRDYLKKLSDDDFQALIDKKNVFLIDVRNKKSIKMVLVKNEDYFLP